MYLSEETVVKLNTFSLELVSDYLDFTTTKKRQS